MPQIEYRARVEADVAARNAAALTLTVWADGTWVIHGYRDAEVATLCEPDKVLLNLDCATFNAVTFITPSERLRLAEKLFGRTSNAK